jgi:hypothetical protein
VKPALAALACLFLAAHLPFLPQEPADIDSVNFALAVQDFDVARHQPHPPGYPVYVALAKVAAALTGGAGDRHAIVTALAAWSAIAGTTLIFLLFMLFQALDGDPRRAWWAMGLTVASPLFWFTALRPLSDMSGLAGAVAAQALIVAMLTGRGTRRPHTLLMAGAFVAGLAAGIRAQTVMLTAPVLLAAILLPRPGLTVRNRLSAGLLAFAGVLVWAVPMLAASGGPAGYLAALGAQAGEDFGGVVMLWTSPTAPVARDAFTYSFLWPWGSLMLGGIVCAAAAVGALRFLLGRPRTLLWVCIAFGPYAIFHLLFHETATVRYALPLVIPFAFLASSAIDWAGPRTATVLGTAIVVLCLVMGASAARAFGSVAPPPAQAMREIGSAAGGTPVGMHAVFRRTAEWIPPPSSMLRAPHGREWLALVDRWKSDPDASLVFVSDPRRTDLALFDVRARELRGSYRWSFPELPYVGGVRPGNTDWYLMRPPGWMLDRGWALSAEIGGVAARDAAGPHRQPSLAWVRARQAPALLMIGGRHLDASGTAHLTLSRGETAIDRWEAAPGFFFRVISLDAGTLQGAGYVPLSVRATSPSTPPVRVSLEQFDLQPDGVEMFGFMAGWHEPEYNPVTARAWRWMSERAVLWVRPIGREVALTLSGESPLRYFDSAPAVRVSIAGQELLRFSPSADFTQQVRLPPDLLAASGGHVVLESDRWFVPAEQGDADQRHLALRIYDAAVR